MLRKGDNEFKSVGPRNGVARIVSDAKFVKATVMISSTLASRDAKMLMRSATEEKHLYIRDYIETVEDECFRRCAVMAVKIAKKEQLTGKCVFQECENLKHVELPEGLEEIPERCFQESGVEIVEIQKSVAVIQKEAFKKCRMLKEVVFAQDSQLKEIGDYAFASCEVL